jgi:hypothetical protein
MVSRSVQHDGATEYVLKLNISSTPEVGAARWPLFQQPAAQCPPACRTRVLHPIHSP